MRAWNKVMLVLGVLLGLQVTLATASGSPLAGSGRRKRLALGMFGLSTPAPGARGPAARVDYRLSLENYRIYLFPQFDEFDIDVFVCTNPSSLSAQLLRDYRPVDHQFLTGGRTVKFAGVLDIIANFSTKHEFEYDGVVLTRFDLLFQGHFGNTKDTAAVDWTALNMISVFDSALVSDDNFYAFAGYHINQIRAGFSNYSARQDLRMAEHGRLLHNYVNLPIHTLAFKDRRRFYAIVRWVPVSAMQQGKHHALPYCTSCGPVEKPYWHRDQHWPRTDPGDRR
jgi:hypothetical protein